MFAAGAISAATVRQVALFREVDDDLARRIGALLKRRHYRKGEIIFHQGDPSGCLYVIDAGRVRISLISPDGREIILRIYGPYETFGEFAVLDGKPRSASAAALDDTSALALCREDFLGLLAQDAALMRHMLALVTERARYATSYSEQLAFLSVPGRVAALLAQLAGAGEEAQRPARLRLTQQELAHLASTTRESVNHALRDFADQGLICVEHQAVVVLDLEGLQHQIR